MGAPRRWIRLDVGWNDSDWLTDLSPGARLSWVLLLGYVKSVGVAGEVKAMGVKGAARAWNVPVKDVTAMLAAAHQDGAITTNDGAWRLTGWDKYQQTDPTAAERKRKQRNALPEPEPEPVTDPVTVGHGMSRVTTVTPPVTCHATETETEEKNSSSSKSEKRRKAQTDLRADWAPNEAHAAKCEESALDLEREATRFRLYHGAKGSRFANWDLAFHTWLTKAVDFAGKARPPDIGSNGKPQPDPRYMTRENIEKLYGPIPRTDW
jgi:hypothetical protein